MTNNARPFLKWAGGKTQLLDQFSNFYPRDLEESNIKIYVEPFIGGGAVFFSLQEKYDFEKVIINDINKNLIITYKVIQNNVNKLINELRNIHNEYHATEDMEVKQNIYYNERKAFNDENGNINSDVFAEKWISHASRMIFLNKTCFNGLYRENKKGGFNVPFGKRVNAPILDEENLKEVNKVLKNVIILNGDFTEVEEYIDKDTFVYIDPPYRPLSNTSNFKDYSSTEFNDESQIRLGNWVRKVWEEKGAKIMLSNSDPKNTNEEDSFFDELYSEFKIERVRALRNINSKGNGRGAINEILVRTY